MISQELSYDRPVDLPEELMKNHEERAGMECPCTVRCF